MNFIELDGELYNLDRVRHIYKNPANNNITRIVFDDCHCDVDVKYDSIKEVIGDMQPCGFSDGGEDNEQTSN